jgi:hypothetical protein
VDLSVFNLSTSDWQAWGGLLVLVVVAKATRTESRTLMAAIAGAIVAPTPATFYVVSLLSLVWIFIDSLHLGRG